MPREAFELRVPFRKVLIGMLVTILPISLFGVYTMSVGSDRLQEEIGGHYETIATGIARQVSEFIRAHTKQVAFMAADPEVREAVETANREDDRMSAEALTAKVQDIEESWTEPESEAFIKRILSSPASEKLRHYLELDPAFLRITVTGLGGYTVAASHPTIDYWQADEEYWQDIFADGHGAISLTDILYDEASQSNYIGIGVPIVDPANNQIIGTLDTLVDVTALFPTIRSVQLGRRGRVQLVKDDGTVIVGPKNVSLSMNLKSDEYAAVLDRLKTLRGRQTGYFQASLVEEGDTLIAFADTGLKEDYQKLGWVVLVAQPSQEAFAAVADTQRFVLFMTFLSLAAIIGVGVYFSLHKTSEEPDIAEEMSHEARVSTG